MPDVYSTREVGSELRELPTHTQPAPLPIVEMTPEQLPAHQTDKSLFTRHETWGEVHACTFLVAARRRCCCSNLLSPLGADDTRGVEQDVDTLHSSLKMLQEQARSTIWRALSNALPPRAMQLLSRDVVTHL